MSRKISEENIFDRGFIIDGAIAPKHDDDALGDNCALDFRVWTRVLEELPAAPVTEHDVLAWVERPLRLFFPFERFLGCYGSLSGGRIQMRSLLTSGHASEFVGGLETAFDLKSRGCFAWWVANRRPFILNKAGGLDRAGVPIVATKRELDEIEQFSLGTIAAHGVIDPYIQAGTYLSFSGVPGNEPKRALAALDLIAPVLHNLFLGTKQAEPSAADLTVLTDRQQELVTLAMTGLSDKAIAKKNEDF